MQGFTDETSVATKYAIDSQMLGVPMCHKVAMRPKPWSLLVAAAAQTPELPMPPPEDEELPVAKRPRLQAPTTFFNAVDGVTVSDSPDDTPTYSVTPAASFPIAATCSTLYRRSWKEEEDTRLIEAVQKLGKASWAAVAVMVSNRSSVQCRRRFLDVLDPENRKKGKWTAEEDAKLIKAIAKYGKDWTRVAEMVPGRTNVKCRERWVGTVDPANCKHCVSWKPEEDAKLTEAVKKYDNNWVSVASMVSGRTDRQCRSRWTLVLDPTNENKGKWTPEENAKLTEAVRRHGNSWVEVAELVPGRTSSQCRLRWKKLEGERNNGNEEALDSVPRSI
jgi:hypothetical protein